MTWTETLFPESERVVYDRPQLTQVICQLRFPTILRIESQPPAEFQELIRAAYPLVERSSDPGIPGLPREVAQLVSKFAKTSYVFKTEDQSFTLTLSPDAIALTAATYRRWEEFWEFFEGPLEALQTIYVPSFYSRVGLRYVNVVRREALELADVPWIDLLNPVVLGELALPQWEDRLELAHYVTRLRGDTEGESVLLQHGLFQGDAENKPGFLLDFDLFTEQKTEARDAAQTLARFNRSAGRAFRWCLKDRLRIAMGPRPLAP